MCFSISSRCGASLRSTAANGCRTTPPTNRCPSGRASRSKRTARSGGSYTTSTRSMRRRPPMLWNAARSGKSEGWFHGYLRMLWGKKLFEWAPDAPTALTWMEALMNRYSLDGRDPVSCASYALGARSLRPSVASPSDLRHASLHVVGERQAQAADEDISSPEILPAEAGSHVPLLRCVTRATRKSELKPQPGAAPGTCCALPSDGEVRDGGPFARRPLRCRPCRKGAP